MRLTVVLLLAAVGLLIAALGMDRMGLAWGSVALSVIAAVLILQRWRRSWLQRQDAAEDEAVLLDDELIPGVGVGDAAVAALTPTPAAPQRGEAQGGDDRRPGEEDTDAADLLLVYELNEEVLVVDEHPRYHLARCRWPDHERAERLPVREARELGFTPCERCRPDKTLAREHRSSRATTTGSG